MNLFVSIALDAVQNFFELAHSNEHSFEEVVAESVLSAIFVGSLAQGNGFNLLPRCDGNFTLTLKLLVFSIVAFIKEIRFKSIHVLRTVEMFFKVIYVFVTAIATELQKSCCLGIKRMLPYRYGLYY